jgi:hypothetical protein
VGWRSIPGQVELHGRTSKINSRRWKRLCPSNDSPRSEVRSRARRQSPREPILPGASRPCRRAMLISCRAVGVLILAGRQFLIPNRPSICCWYSRACFANVASRTFKP